MSDHSKSSRTRGAWTWCGTPTFFINGVRHNGWWDADSLLVALDAAH